MRRLSLALALGFLVLAACPDRKEIGHAPKKTLDRVERSVGNAENKMQQRAEKGLQAIGEPAASAPAAADEP